MSRYAFRLVGIDVSWTRVLGVPLLRPRRDERRFLRAGAAGFATVAVAAAECGRRADLDRRAGRDDLSRDDDAFFGVAASAYGVSWGGRGNWLNG